MAIGNEIAVGTVQKSRAGFRVLDFDWLSVDFQSPFGLEFHHDQHNRRFQLQRSLLFRRELTSRERETREYKNSEDTTKFPHVPPPASGLAAKNCNEQIPLPNR